MAKRREEEEARGGGTGWIFALGAGAGLALGMYLSGERGEEGATRRRRVVEGARESARRFRPGRMRRPARDHQQLEGLEDGVLTALMADEVLAGRGIDVGAISLGIVELSGVVRSDAEAARAVSLAGSVRGVETVVNRMEIEAAAPAPAARETAGGEWSGRSSGMGRRRQSHDTDPDRADDAQHIRELSLEHADRMQYEDEDLAHAQPRVGARPGGGDPNPTRFRESELDNQDPFGKHAVSVPAQPQALNSASRVGDGVQPGTELRLEAADVPVKPHTGNPPEGGNR